YLGGGSSLEGYDLFAIDSAGHIGGDYLITVPSPLNPAGGVGGLDHFAVRTQSTAQDGGTAMVTVRAVTATNSPIAVTDEVVIYHTTPEGGYVLPDTFLFRFADDFGFPRSQITIPLPLQGKGRHVIVVTNSLNTGTTAITVR